MGFQLGLPSGNQIWQWSIPYEWRFQWEKKSSVSGGYSSVMFDYRRVDLRY